MGLKINPEDLDFYKNNKISIVNKHSKDNEFGYIFFLKFDGEITQLRIQDEEVQAIKFISLDELEKELVSNYSIFCPHGDYWFEMIREARKKLQLF